MPLPTLVLIHGYPFDKSLWNDVTAALQGKAQVLTPNLPGFGGEPLPAGEPSIDAMADAVAAFMDANKVKAAVVAGMSMGGYVALAFAERHAKRLEGLGLISTQAMNDTDETKETRRSLIQKVRSEGVKVAVDVLMPKMFSEQAKANEQFLGQVRHGADQAGKDGICWALEAMARRPDRTSVLAHLSVPAVVIHGSEDKIIPAQRAEQMAKTLPNASFVELSGVGHASPLEDPSRVASALADLVNRAKRGQATDDDKRSENLPGIIVGPTDKGL